MRNALILLRNAKKFLGPLQEQLKTMPEGKELLEKLKKGGLDEKSEEKKGTSILALLLEAAVGIPLLAVREMARESLRQSFSEDLK